MINPLVAHDIVNSRSLSRVIVKNFCDEVTSTVCDRHILREAISVHPDSFVGCLDIRRLKRWLSNDQCVDNDAN